MSYVVKQLTHVVSQHGGLEWFSRYAVLIAYTWYISIHSIS